MTLTEAQELNFPGSRILSAHDAFMRWAMPDGGTGEITREMTENGWRIARCIMQQPGGTFYETPRGNRGYRYGIDVREYVSGFLPYGI